LPSVHNPLVSCIGIVRYQCGAIRYLSASLVDNGRQSYCFDSYRCPMDLRRPTSTASGASVATSRSMAKSITVMVASTAALGAARQQTTMASLTIHLTPFARACQGLLRAFGAAYQADYKSSMSSRCSSNWERGQSWIVWPGSRGAPSRPRRCSSGQD
jgi:hypothetical protein